MSKDIKITFDKQSLATAGSAAVRFIGRYAVVLFFILVSSVYGFVVLRINILSNAQPSQSEIDAQVTATPVPRIDPAVADQLQQMKDNSVNVQTLFDQARQNPFQ